MCLAKRSSPVMYLALCILTLLVGFVTGCSSGPSSTPEELVTIQQKYEFRCPYCGKVHGEITTDKTVLASEVAKQPAVEVIKEACKAPHCQKMALAEAEKRPAPTGIIEYKRDPGTVAGEITDDYRQRGSAALAPDPSSKDVDKEETKAGLRELGY